MLTRGSLAPTAASARLRTGSSAADPHRLAPRGVLFLACAPELDCALDLALAFVGGGVAGLCRRRRRTVMLPR